MIRHPSNWKHNSKTKILSNLIGLKAQKLVVLGFYYVYVIFDIMINFDELIKKVRRTFNVSPTFLSSSATFLFSSLETPLLSFSFSSSLQILLVPHQSVSNNPRLPFQPKTIFKDIACFHKSYYLCLSNNALVLSRISKRSKPIKLFKFQTLIFIFVFKL